MSASDPVADMLTKIRNAAQARHEKVDIPVSKLKLEIVKILKTEGYIKNFKKVQEDNKSIIRIFLPPCSWTGKRAGLRIFLQMIAP
jgi:small subunit ribosomal protein S8